MARIDSEGEANRRGGSSLPAPVFGLGPMGADPSTDAALPCGAWRVMSRFEIKILILEIRNCDGRGREKRQHNRCGLEGGGGARHRSTFAALADADLAGLGLRRVKLIQMENNDNTSEEAITLPLLLMPNSPLVWIGID